MKEIKSDIVIVGCGVSGLYAALNLPRNLKISILSKDSFTHSDSYLAQGGICMLKDENDYDSYFEDTLKAGHYENDKTSVDIMIRSSCDVINDLVSYGVSFAQKDGRFLYTKEGAHSTNRILYHKDITGKEITTQLLSQVMKLDNVTCYEYTTMSDLICKNNACYGISAFDNDSKETYRFLAAKTILATGGIGGQFLHTTNFPHLTGDAITLALKHQVKTMHLDYIQIHPTTLYTKESGRKFLISESVRGEGAILLDKNKHRFVDELLPRDVLTKKIKDQMQKDDTAYVYLSMLPLGQKLIQSHFPTIYQHCLSQGYDVTKEPIPVVPAQHYFMGGIAVDYESHTSMKHLYAVGETACNGVHGANRLASNSLLESLVFAKRAAKNITKSSIQSIVLT